MSSLTYEQAKAVWKQKWQLRKKREICAEFDVDPRRLYEVWEEKIHKGSREEAYVELCVENPTLAAQISPKAHVPHLRVVKRVTQPDLFA